MKKKVKMVFLIIGYLVLILPMCFCIYYSVPASDDFGTAVRLNEVGLFLPSVKHSLTIWSTWGGRWVSQFFWTFANPLNSHIHLGHKYGLYMIVLFIIFTIMIVYSLNVCMKRVLDDNSSFVSIVTFIVMAIFYSTYYYSECYNWFIGAMVYTVPLGFIMITVAAMIKYAESDFTSTKYYIVMILAGILPATMEYCDVAIGICYVYFIYYCHLNERLSEDIKLKIKNAFPLILYVLLGISSVFAPGNKVRQEYYQLDLSITKSFIQYVKDVLIRIQDLIIDHPMAIILFILLIVIGINSNQTHKKIERIPHVIILFAIVITGALYPYIYGRGFDSTYIDVRMEFILDFSLYVCIAILCIMFGRYLSYRLELELNKKDILFITAGFVLFVYVSLLQNYAYLDIVQMDILRNKNVIVESYNYWDDVLIEIENSDEDVVVIERDYVPDWSRYFLSVGIENGEIYGADSSKIYDEEQIMPNVYYGKKSIQMKIKGE